MAKPRSKGGRKPPEVFHFGTPDEVGNREFEAGLYDQGGDPQNSHPNFKQIPPSTASGSVNRAGLGHRSGEMKFSGGPGKL
jgi:hypothetical protein